MKSTMKTAALMAAAFLATMGAAMAVDPLVSDVTMEQIKDTRKVAITYKLQDAPAIITLSIETNGVAIPDSAVTQITGDVDKLIQPGTATRSIQWNAGKDWPEHITTAAKACVTAWYTNAPPLYCAVDVAGGASASTYPVYYYTSAVRVPGGITNDLYKTMQILLRKLPATGAQGFKMGSSITESARDAAMENWHDVVLTKAFYAGVYEVTQRQWQQVMGDAKPNQSHFTVDRWMRPVEQVSYYHIREDWTRNPNWWGQHDQFVDWPNTDHVNLDSFMGRLRARTALSGFDLPTEAQWEYACRAGTSGALNNETISFTNDYQTAQIDPVGRYQWNHAWNGTAPYPDGYSSTNAGTAIVGSYMPNAWGLYDMHGNVSEYCLDKVSGNYATSKVWDPAGDTSGDTCVMRGGSWLQAAYYCRSARRNTLGLEGSASFSTGFRLFRNIERYLPPTPTAAP